ncbi:hypothetical protein BH11PSE13_BH11PSE13_45100 [soil metagenome]
MTIITPIIRMTHDGRFAEGDHVTRDGTDLQLVVFINEAGDAGVFRCLVPPTSGWCEVGEEEFISLGATTA